MFRVLGIYNFAIKVNQKMAFFWWFPCHECTIKNIFSPKSSNKSEGQTREWNLLNKFFLLYIFQVFARQVIFSVNGLLKLIYIDILLREQYKNCWLISPNWQPYFSVKSLHIASPLNSKITEAHSVILSRFLVVYHFMSRNLLYYLQGKMCF